MYFNWLPEEMLKRKIVRDDHYEIIWKIQDAMLIVDLAMRNNILILGGDVLDSSFQYNYANWFYNPEETLNRMENILMSGEKAKKFLNEYIKQNGMGDYVIIVEE